MSVAATPVSFMPRWARITIACFLLAVAALSMWEMFLRFDWVGFLCFGLFYLIHVPMQKGESPRTYFSKPRTIVSFGLIVAVMGSALHTVTRYFSLLRGAI